MGLLPYHVGTALTDIAKATTTKPYTTDSTGSYDHSQEVFTILDIKEYDDEEGNISSHKASIVEEIDAYRASPQCKNRKHAQRHTHAQHHCTAT